jgi:amino-acid N-acetyltransferase
MLKKATEKHLGGIQQLLRDAELPYEDVVEHLDHFIIAEDQSTLIGCVGLEIYANVGLLRSLVVVPKFRKEGLGENLVNHILANASSQQIQDLYLLTTSAEAYFLKFGFIKIDRDKAPEEIRNTTQFSKLCPTSAVLMQKHFNKTS